MKITDNRKRELEYVSFFIKEEKIQQTSEINSEISLKNNRNYKENNVY